MPKDKRPTYEEMLERSPEFEGIIPKLSWEHQGATHKKTEEYFKKLWMDNLEKNIKNKHWKKHGSIKKDCVDIGKNKALVAVGAGKSFQKNGHILKKLHDLDGVKSWQDRDFIIVASNHMYKPLLNMGIIPDFVIVVDASDIMMQQLNEDIPSSGQNSVLLTGLHCSPKVLNEWVNQGREIRFYLPMNIGLEEPFQRLTGKHPKHHLILQGGNVLNTLWSIAFVYLHSTTFMALGNDLSYTLHDKLDDQRNDYYADGDYSSNIKNKRDEAHKSKQWLGFTLTPANIYTGRLRYNISLDLVGTSPTLWVYKTWMESTILLHANKSRPYHYFNCSEGGILGVMCKSMEFDVTEMKKDESWFLLDEKCHRWHTWMFQDAINHFIQAKEALGWPTEIPFDAQNVTGLAQATQT